MASANKKTVVLGASDNPERYSNMAINKLRAHGHDVVAIGKRKSFVADVPVQLEATAVPDVDTVTVYLNPNNQKSYYDYILSLHPKRIIFNPGAENPELEELAGANHIKTQEACTLVLLGTGQY
ncbi:MAG: CoA-binding protein [Bacteroidota bacterium]|nr:CoA-binding protein [Bacteroidota bacterium]MDP4211722.1 CoA-binding protein [Bacteroidota bacterium]MDP4250406.1 CoA-binding protein [Bacteroidota bacterium]